MVYYSCICTLRVTKTWAKVSSATHSMYSEKCMTTCDTCPVVSGTLPIELKWLNNQVNGKTTYLTAWKSWTTHAAQPAAAHASCTERPDSDSQKKIVAVHVACVLSFHASSLSRLEEIFAKNMESRVVALVIAVLICAVDVALWFRRVGKLGLTLVTTKLQRCTLTKHQSFLYFGFLFNLIQNGKLTTGHQNEGSNGQSLT